MKSVEIALFASIMLIAFIIILVNMLVATRDAEKARRRAAIAEENANRLGDKYIELIEELKRVIREKEK